MSAVRFTTTRLSGLRAAGRLNELQHSVIAPFLERELGPRHARLFADFETEGSDLRAWYAEADTPPRRVADLPSDRAEAVRTAVMELVRDVRSLADRLAAEGPRKANLSRILMAATTYPEEDVWCAGDQPIIVNWGFDRQEALERAPRAITGGARREHAPIAPPIREPILFLQARRWSFASAAAPLLWLLFTLLLAATYYTLLPACGIDARWRLLSGWRFLDACEGADIMVKEAAEGARLQALVRQSELEVVRERQLCSTPQKAARSDPPLPAPTPTRETRIDQQIERRLPQTAPRGQTEISLLWDGHADLDLIVICPNGDQLSQASPGLRACGGRLLEDINKAGGPMTDRPIEHAAWEQPASGAYTVKVQLYDYNDVPDGSDIPFTIRIRRGADEQIHAGHVKGARAIVTAASVAF